MQVVLEQLSCERVERRLHRCDLRQNIDAIAVLVDHPRDAANLALDPVQPLPERHGIALSARDDGVSLRSAGPG
jgi:hypothetical protein